MLINNLPIIMFKCLMYTIIIEVIVSIILGIRERKDFINIILVNIMTNPLVTSIPVFMNIRFGILERNISLLILEVFAILSEGFVYSKYLKLKKIKPYILSIILNGASYFIGGFINVL